MSFLLRTSNAGMSTEERLRMRRILGVHERQGLFVAAGVRTGLILAVFVWQAIDFPFRGAAYLYGLAIPLVFFALGIAHMVSAKYSPWPVKSAAGLFVIDVVAMAIFFTMSNPYVGLQIPYFMAFRWDNLHWYFIVLAQAAMALNWRLVAWCGFLIGSARLSQLWFVLSNSESFTEIDIDMTDAGVVFEAYKDIAFVSIGQRWGELLAIAGVTGGLIAVVTRSHRLVIQHAAAERGRASLARYFSPNMVEALMTRHSQWRRPKRQRLVVMFIDIVGFTRMCAAATPEFAVELLRGFHTRIADRVFAHHGTLDKYIGDAVMVTFGSPFAVQEPASSSMDCAIAIGDEMRRWNKERYELGEAPVKIGIGMHIGEAVVGDIGDHRRLEFAVIGDVVNRAARLEKLTRQLGFDIVVSEAFVQALQDEGARLDMLQPLGGHVVPGIDTPLAVWGTGSKAELSA